MRITCVILIVLFVIFLRSSTAIVPGYEKNVAESSAVLDTNGDVSLKWRVDYAKKTIRFSIQFLNDDATLTWFAFGFSDRGSLNNSDVCVLWIDYKGRDHFTDMHSTETGILIRDQTQDYQKVTVDRKTGTVSFERKLNTCDPNDYVITDGTVHVIWARGSDKLYTANGLCLPCTDPKNHGFIRVRLLTPPQRPESDGQKQEIPFTVRDVKVPSSDTTYWCKVFQLPDYITSTPHHIVQFQSSITSGNEGLVHHMEVFYCDADVDTEIPLYEGNCFSPDRPVATKVCTKVKAAWAMGALPFIYPKEAGLPLGGPAANKYVMLEIHYNNPEKRDDWIDSSGITVFVTRNKRKYDAAIMELGLEYTDKMAIPPGQEEFTLSGFCLPQCTAVGLPKSGIIVFASQLHTHLTGTAVWTRHARNKMETKNLNRDMHYSTHFQEIRMLHKPVRVMPGDYLETVCIYNTKDRVNATIGGHAITDEMCVNYIHYYPATHLEVCKSSVSNKALENYFKFESIWDGMPINFNNPPRQNYLAIDPWTEMRVSALEELYMTSPISMQCNKSDGTRFQGKWEGLPLPNILPLAPETPTCPPVIKPEDIDDATRTRARSGFNMNFF